MSASHSNFLVVWNGQGPIGKLFDTEPVSFLYEADCPECDWIPTLPYSPCLIEGPQVLANFENLLPEGMPRHALELRFKTNTVFGLLSEIGADCIGAISLLKPNQQKPAHKSSEHGATKHSSRSGSYSSISWQELNTLLHANKASEQDVLALNTKHKLAGNQPLPLSGAQFKVGISISPDGKVLMPHPGASTEYIVKPDIVRPDIRIFHSALNEFLTMKLAEACGLRVAEVFYQKDIQSCVIKRFDRAQATKFHQLDFCQLAGVPSHIKYEKDGGPSLVDCWALLEAHSVQVLKDKTQLLDWLFFNLLVGNDDCHAKNLSLQFLKGGAKLAPFYDLMCTKAYPGLGQEFAFTVGGTRKTGRLKPEHLTLLATQLGTKPNYLSQRLAALSERLNAQLPGLVVSIQTELPATHHASLVRFATDIRSQARKLSKRLLQGLD